MSYQLSGIYDDLNKLFPNKGYELGIPGLPGFDNIGLDTGTGFLPGDTSIPIDFGGYDTIPVSGGGVASGGVLGGLSNNINGLLDTAVKGAGAYATIKNIISDPSLATTFPTGGTVNTGVSNAGAPVNSGSILNNKYFGLTVPELFILGAGILFVSKLIKGR